MGGQTLSFDLERRNGIVLARQKSGMSHFIISNYSTGLLNIPIRPDKSRAQIQSHGSHVSRGFQGIMTSKSFC